MPETYTAEHHARPAFKGYRGYPGSVCTSINQEVVHGIPSPPAALREGDILSMDFGVELDGYFARCGSYRAGGKDSAGSGRSSASHARIARSRDRQGAAGNRLGDVSAAVQEWVEENGFSVVREFVGHGIGTKMHEEPQVPNYGAPGQGPRLAGRHGHRHRADGEFGRPGVRMLDDDWTAVTADGSDSAHFEHTVAVTANGPWILTRPKDVTGPCW